METDMPSDPKKSIEIELLAELRNWREMIEHDRLAHIVKDAARRFSRSLQLRLGSHKITFGHWAFLRVLWEEDGLTQRELSERTGLMEPTAFSALKAMEELGFISRTKIPGNRKNLCVRLTERGHQLKSTLIPLAEEVNHIAISGISPENLKIVRHSLLTIIENLAADEMKASNRDIRIPPTRRISRPRLSSLRKDADC